MAKRKHSKKDDEVTGLAFVLCLICAAGAWVISHFKIIAIILGVFVLLVVLIMILDNNAKKNRENQEDYPKMKIEKGHNTSKKENVSNSKSNNKKDERLEREMEAQGLWDDEKEEVRKGNWDSWSFDEDDPEPDDYYAEDDK